MLEVPSGTLEDWIKAINERRAPPLDRFGYGFVGRAGRVRLREVERKAYSIKVCTLFITHSYYSLLLLSFGGG